jgi:hypothetical protein
MKGLWVLLLALLVLVVGRIPAAQNGKRQIPWCTLTGSVVDEKGKPVASALVYLREVRGRKVTMKHAGPDGKFRFGWVDLRVEHEIYAEGAESFSATVLISRSDKRKEIAVRLKLSRIKR